ncbi:MAG: hypothetical protein IKZ07_08535 [Akkermansia sp.]|nr:hypothetical protein [Akkermansia sp.]
MKYLRTIRLLLMLTILPALVAWGVSLWNYVADLTDPVMVPVNKSYEGYSTVPQKAPGLKLEQFTFQGKDGGEVLAVIANKDGEESSRQLNVIGDLTSNKADNLGTIDYALICVDWDHGIRSALPLAETLTAAGITCVLWEPRGTDNRRRYCTHGLLESGDVPLLIDELIHRSGKSAPVIVGVGQGYGAGLMLQAAVAEPRIQGLIAIDAYASLRESLSRTMPDTLLTQATLWLMDLRLHSSVGFECFDVAPVESAAKLNRDLPVLIINLVQNNPIRNLDDAVNIYRQLPCDRRDLWTLRNNSDAPHAVTRAIQPTKSTRAASVEARLLQDEDGTAIAMVHWLNDTVVTALDTPHVRVPARPLLTSDSQL